MDTNNEILDAIEILADKKIGDKGTQIFIGKCIGFNGKYCDVIVNGIINNIQYYGVPPQTNELYQVFVPGGNMSRAFIIVPMTNIVDFYKKEAINYGGISSVTATQTRGANTLELYVSTFDGIPSETLLTNLTTYLNSTEITKKQPIAMDIQVKAPTLSTVTIYLQIKPLVDGDNNKIITFSQVVQATKRNLTAFFNEQQLGLTDIVQKINLILEGTPEVSQFNVVAPKKNTVNSENVLLALGRVTTEIIR